MCGCALCRNSLTRTKPCASSETPAASSANSSTCARRPVATSTWSAKRSYGSPSPLAHTLVWLRAGGEHHALAFDHATVDAQPARILERGRASHERNAFARIALLGALRAGVADDAVLARDHARPIEADVLRAQPVLSRFLQLRVHARRAQQRLAGHARVVGAVAAQFVFFDDGHRVSIRSRYTGRRLTRRAA